MRLIVLHPKGEAMEPGMAGLGRMGANITDAKLIASLRNEFAGHAVKKE
jgi:6-phosphogluconate dehydrogenase (decarboxylating)